MKRAIRYISVLILFLGFIFMVSSCSILKKGNDQYDDCGCFSSVEQETHHG